MKIRPLGAEILIQADTPIWHDEENSHFSQFCEKPKKESLVLPKSRQIFRDEGSFTAQNNALFVVSAVRVSKSYVQEHKFANEYLA
jgi:hypothetical protein